MVVIAAAMGAAAHLFGHILHARFQHLPLYMAPSQARRLEAVHWKSSCAMCGSTEHLADRARRTAHIPCKRLRVLLLDAASVLNLRGAHLLESAILLVVSTTIYQACLPACLPASWMLLRVCVRPTPVPLAL